MFAYVCNSWLHTSENFQYGNKSSPPIINKKKLQFYNCRLSYKIPEFWGNFRKKIEFQNNLNINPTFWQHFTRKNVDKTFFVYSYRPGEGLAHSHATAVSRALICKGHSFVKENKYIYEQLLLNVKWYFLEPLNIGNKRCFTITTHSFLLYRHRKTKAFENFREF